MTTKVFTFVFAVAGLALLVACSATPTTVEQANPAHAPAFAQQLPEGCKLGPVARVDGAAIYAVIDPSAPSHTEFVTLDEAMAQNQCTVREVADGGSVNTLKISNSGQKPIFCMAGDLVLGGQQDRILAESLVVAPATKDQDIPVFCVEHGRWTAQDKDGTAAKEGCFKNSGERGQVDLNVKKAALDSRNQSMVWEEVARNNEKMKVGEQTESGTFRATFDDKATSEKIEKGFAAAQKLVGTGVVGFAVVCKDELVAMDVFESTELCAKLSDKLLRSYVITGIGGGYESTCESSQPAIVFGCRQEQTIERADRLDRSRRSPLTREDLAVRSQLDTIELSFCFEETRLTDVVKSLREESNLNVLLATTVSGSDLVTIDVGVVKLRQALNLLCESVATSIEWRIQDGAIVIGPRVQIVNGQFDEALAGTRTRPQQDQQPPTETPPSPPPAPIATTPNANTETKREYTRESVKYDCTDKKSGKVVQRSFLKR